MSFAECPDAGPAAELLQRSLLRGRLAHAYLFAGTRPESMTGVIHALAQAVNCPQPARTADGRAYDGCGQCAVCRRIHGESHPDMHWLRPESKSRLILIDQVHELLQAIYLKPLEAGYKIAVIAGAERMNASAANALLKTLEEPPAKSILILTTRDPQQVLETITSRCLRLNFPADSARRLDADALAFLRQFSVAAAVGTAAPMGRYRLLGVLQAELGRLKAEAEKILTARSPLEKHPDAEPKLREKWEKELDAAIEGEYRARRARLLEHVQWWLRDIWLLTLGGAGELLACEELRANSEAAATRLASTGKALCNLEAVEKIQAQLASNVQEGLALEVGFLRLEI